MNKKGFTLIELLAVIVILAIIAIIVTPMIASTIKSARENSIKASAINYANAVDQSIAATMAKGGTFEDKTYNVSDLSKVEVTGQKPTSGTVKVEKGVVTDFDLTIGNYEATRTGADGEVTVTEVGSGNTPTKQYTDAVLNGTDPVLDAGMIAVTINADGTVTKADTFNSTNPWYKYESQQWANAILTTSDVRSAYQSASAGTIIDKTKILAYLVWIPRYKYQLFNVEGVVSTAKTINITFESAKTTKSNGTVDGSWLTHPGFTFGTTELNGFWVGKFEMTGTKTNPSVLPNATSLTNLNVSTFFSTIQGMKSDTYGLTSDSHMMMNKEWGAVAYLTQSIYGKNTEVRINNNSNYTTGCGSSTDNGSAIAACQIVYGSATDYPQSTTGNISGIFDMSGGAYELVMGTINSTISSSGFSILPDSKYYQTYTTQANSPNGDAIKETVTWYRDLVDFQSATYPWSDRGGAYDSSSDAGLFDFSGSKGSAAVWDSTRMVVAPME